MWLNSQGKFDKRKSISILFKIREWNLNFDYSFMLFQSYRCDQRKIQKRFIFSFDTHEWLYFWKQACLIIKNNIDKSFYKVDLLACWHHNNTPIE